MTTTPPGQVPDALRLADLLLNLQTHMGPRRPSHPDDAHCWDGYTQSSAELRRLHAENEALRAAHVQNPAEIEHVAGDVSKNGAELNVSTQQQECGNTPYDEGPFALAQPVAQRGAADGFFLLLPQRPKPEAPAGTAGLDWDAYSGAQMLAFGRDCSDAAIAALRAQQPAPDYEAGWKDGYKHGAWPTQQPAPATQQVGEVRRAELVPGVMHCAKCKFQLNRVTLCVSDGNAYAGNNKTEPCPNGCGPLWPVTWEQEAKNCWKALEEMHERLMAAATPQPSPTPQADSQPAPEYVGNGMFKGETIQKAAEHYRNAIARACEGWTMPDGLRKHLETALWSPPTPQPAQAQAGAVPLTDAQIRAMLNKHPPEDVCGWSYRMGIDDAELHHGIKGGQHGAE